MMAGVEQFTPAIFFTEHVLGDRGTVVSTQTAAADAAPSAGSASAALDERISHRGPMRRWLISPEIGALIGTILVWSFFWGVGKTFGEADTTLNWLDVAAPYGIMATAVAMLMIGGEFDLSAGVMTGATAIHIGLFSQYFMGTGVNIGWGIAGCFLAAAAVGWFNGFMVNKTGLPSFIITLASFFVLRGIILVMAKRLGGKVQVNEIDKARGAAGFKNWIAHEWKFTEFTGRDQLFLALVVFGAATFAYGLLDQSFVRRLTVDMKSIGALVVGVAAAVIGFFGLHSTDGVSKNGIFSLIGGLGVVIGMVGLATTRWEARPRVAMVKEAISRDVAVRIGAGVLGIVLACLVPSTGLSVGRS
jgi:ribose/xylose/arabinose/galactoside ABC-type transport system permease subunit